MKKTKKKRTIFVKLPNPTIYKIYYKIENIVYINKNFNSLHKITIYR